MGFYGNHDARSLKHRSKLYFWHFSDTVLRNADHSCWRGGEATCWGQHWAGVGAGGGGRRGHVGAERQIWWKFTRKNTFLSTVGGPAEQTSCEDEHWEFVDFKCWVSHQCMCAVPHLWECTHGRENVCLRVTVHVHKTPIKRNDVDLSYLHSSLRGPKSNSHTLATGLSLSLTASCTTLTFNENVFHSVLIRNPAVNYKWQMTWTPCSWGIS